MKILNLENYKKIYSISDIHGNLDAFKYACSQSGLLDFNGNINLDEEIAIVINGDVFDYFYNRNDERKEFEKCSFYKPKSWAMEILNQFSVTDTGVIGVIDFIYGDNFSSINKVFDLIIQRIGKTKFKLEILGALHVLETLKYLEKQKTANKDGVFMLMGNHDLDFLNGEWEFRSLQKNFIYSVLQDQMFISYREHKDLKENLPSILLENNDYSRKKTWIDSGSPVINIIDEKNIIAITGKNIYVHAGLPSKMLATLNTCFEDEISAKLLNIAIFYSKNKIGPDSIFTCDTVGDFPTENKDGYLEFLKKIYKERVIVGHNPFLGINNLSEVVDISDLTKQELVFSIKDLGYVVKQDVGIKFGNSTPKFFIE